MEMTNAYFDHMFHADLPNYGEERQRKWPYEISLQLSYHN